MTSGSSNGTDAERSAENGVSRERSISDEASHVGNRASQGLARDDQRSISDEASLAKALKAARKNAGLTQQELCEKADLSYSTLAKIERGAIKAPSIFTIAHIAAVVGLSLDELVGDSLGGVTPKKTSKKISKAGTRFVYFDINGCLVRFFHRAFASLAEQSGAKADAVEAIFWHYNDTVCRGEMSIDEFNGILNKKLGCERLDWREHYLDAVEPIEEMTDLVKWAAEHYHIGLLSNIMPGLIAAMTERDMLPRADYDAIIDSSSVKAIKPEQHIFDVALEKSGVEPHEILFVDDSRTNIMAAERDGWKVMWFDDYRPDESAERIRKALEY
ncbi:MAG: HAD-IA family hydrolase [Candidatus Saccharibacteria bacterium]|nr:HAD-IA family hydrolase [Candidatus Saccharibacteria bacterium]